MSRRILSASFLCLAVPACGGESARRVQVERDTVGDTVVVRTLAGSEWEAHARLEPEVRIGTFEGEDEYMLGDVAGLAVAPDGAMYIYDRQIPALRKYDADGRFVATFGREGGGPGEYKQSDGGLAVLSDGRVLLRDPGNGRINVYSATGESLDHWPLRAGHFTSRPLYVDTAGRTYTQLWGTNEAGDRYSGLQAYGMDGVKQDSILAPRWEYDAPSISASREGMSMMNAVPFSPTEQWSFTPHAFMVGGLSTRYAIDVFRPDSTVLRMERVSEPVAVQADEKTNAEARASANFRRSFPDWKWNGPAIPDRKPPYRAILAGQDGRIYVQLWMPGERIPDEELETPEDPNAPPPDRWREPVVYDVFETDGTYLGQVRTPHRFATYPQPVFDRDNVWAVVTDDLEVEYVTRFRIVREADRRG